MMKGYLNYKTSKVYDFCSLKSQKTKDQPPYKMKERSYFDNGSLNNSNSKILKEKQY